MSKGETVSIASTDTASTFTPPRRNPVLSYFSLFTSVGTLLCCALPSLLVLLGFGAGVGAVLSAAPWLVTLSHHKAWVFTASGVLIMLSVLLSYVVSPKLSISTGFCPPGDSACGTADRFNRVVLWIATTLYAAGFFVAYALGPILSWLDR